MPVYNGTINKPKGGNAGYRSTIVAYNELNGEYVVHTSVLHYPGTFSLDTGAVACYLIMIAPDPDRHGGRYISATTINYNGQLNIKHGMVVSDIKPVEV